MDGIRFVYQAVLEAFPVFQKTSKMEQFANVVNSFFINFTLPVI